MRYLSLFLAYFFVSLLLLLAILFPLRPDSAMGFFTLTLVLVPVVGTFDMLGQRMIEADWFTNFSYHLKAACGIIFLIIFVFALYIVIQIIGITTIPW